MVSTYHPAGDILAMSRPAAADQAAVSQADAPDGSPIAINHQQNHMGA